MSNPTPIVSLTTEHPSTGGLSSQQEVDLIVLTITTPKIKKAGTNAAVYAVIGGREYLLDKKNYNDFEQGKTDSYSLSFKGNLDDIRSNPIKIYHDNSNKYAGWYCGKVIMYVSLRGEYWQRTYKTWDDIGWLAEDVAPNYTTEAILQEEESLPFQIENPYKNLPYNLKGQCHCHTTESDGKDSPDALMKAYRDKNYSFVCITDHNCCTDDPFTKDILHINSGEDGKKNRHHLLNLGINKDLLDSSVDKNMDGIDDRASKPCANIQPRINYMAFTQDGISVIAHPTASHAPEDFGFTLDELKNCAGYLGMEIFNPSHKTHPYWSMNSDHDKSDRDNVSWWDETLYHKKYPLWGFAADDCHDVNGKDFNRGWIVVNCSRNMDRYFKYLEGIEDLEKTNKGKLHTLSDEKKAALCYKAQRAYRVKTMLHNDVVDNIKSGNFYSVVRSPQHPSSKYKGTNDLGPAMEITVNDKTIFVKTDLDSSIIRFVTGSQSKTKTVDGKKIPHTVLEKGKSASYTCNGDELYVRIEIEQQRSSGVGSVKETYIAFSQPIFIQSTTEAKRKDYNRVK